MTLDSCKHADKQKKSPLAFLLTSCLRPSKPSFGSELSNKNQHGFPDNRANLIAGHIGAVAGKQPPQSKPTNPLSRLARQFFK